LEEYAKKGKFKIDSTPTLRYIYMISSKFTFINWQSIFVLILLNVAWKQVPYQSICENQLN